LKQAISTVLSGSTWQRCRVHFMRNLLATVPQGTREAIAAVVRTIFAQPDPASAMMPLRKVAEGLRMRFPRAATVLEVTIQTELLVGTGCLVLMISFPFDRPVVGICCGSRR
jgi:transposase-like protein